MSYLDNLYSPPTEVVNEEITISKKYKNFGDMLKHYAKKAAIGAGVAGLAGYGLYRAGQDGKAAVNNAFSNAKKRFNEDSLDPRYTGGKSLVDGYNTFSALGYKRPENLKKLDNKLFGKRDDTEPVVSGWFGNTSKYNNG